MQDSKFYTAAGTAYLQSSTMRIVHAYHRWITTVDWNFSTKKWPDPIGILDADTRHLTNAEQARYTVNKSAINSPLLNLAAIFSQ